MRNRGRLAQEGSTAQAAPGACATSVLCCSYSSDQGASTRPPTH